jgi:uncharacterized membrane protein
VGAALSYRILERALAAAEGQESQVRRAVGAATKEWLSLALYVAIYWNNHHHMMQSARQVAGAVLWANHALLFCLTLFPLMIRWIDEAGPTPWPVASFGLVLVLASICYVLLERALIGAEGEDSRVKSAVGHGAKEWISFCGYVAAVPLAFVSPLISIAIYVAVAFLWLVPDRRFERRLHQ